MAVDNGMDAAVVDEAGPAPGERLVDGAVLGADGVGDGAVVEAETTVMQLPAEFPVQVSHAAVVDQPGDIIVQPGMQEQE